MLKFEGRVVEMSGGKAQVVKQGTPLDGKHLFGKRAYQDTFDHLRSRQGLVDYGKVADGRYYFQFADGHREQFTRKEVRDYYMNVFRGLAIDHELNALCRAGDVYAYCEESEDNLSRKVAVTQEQAQHLGRPFWTVGTAEVWQDASNYYLDDHMGTDMLVFAKADFPTLREVMNYYKNTIK